MGGKNLFFKLGGWLQGYPFYFLSSTTFTEEILILRMACLITKHTCICLEHKKLY